MSDSNIPRRGGRRRTGTIVNIGSKRSPVYQAIVTLNSGRRKRLPPLPVGTSEAKARDFAAHWAARAKDAPTSAAEETRDLTRSTRPGDRWFAAWLADKEARGQTSARDKQSHWDHHLGPFLAKNHPSKWTAEDLRNIVAELDSKVQSGKLSWKSALNIWGTATSMCSDAVSSKVDALRCRGDNPSRDVKGPDKGADKQGPFLYPTEFSQLMQCKKVPVRFRRIVALACFMGLRQGELVVLRWDDLDFEHGRFRIHRSRRRDGQGIKSTKAGKVRKDKLHPNLIPLLRAMKRESSGEELVLYDRPAINEFARQLREHLGTAGCKRAALHEDGDTTRHIVFHDLRATYATWLALDGVNAWEMVDRIGHGDIKTTQRYVREAEEIRDTMTVRPFPPLPDALLGEQTIRAIDQTKAASPRSRHFEGSYGLGLASPAGFEAERTISERARTRKFKGLATPMEARKHLVTHPRLTLTVGRSQTMS